VYPRCDACSERLKELCPARLAKGNPADGAHATTLRTSQRAASLSQSWQTAQDSILSGRIDFLQSGEGASPIRQRTGASSPTPVDWTRRSGRPQPRRVFLFIYVFRHAGISARISRDWLGQRTWKNDQLFTIPTCNYERALVSNSIGSAESSVSPPYQRQQTILVLTIHLNASRGDRPRAVSKTVARKPASNSEGIPIPIAHTKCPTRQLCSGYGRRRQRGGG
jgi:hypothetical protein